MSHRALTAFMAAVLWSTGCLFAGDALENPPTLPDWEPEVVVACVELTETVWPGPGDDTVGEDWASNETWNELGHSIGFVASTDDIDTFNIDYDREADDGVFPHIGWGHAFTWIAGAQGTLIADTEGSQFDTYLAISGWSLHESELVIQCHANNDVLDSGTQVLGSEVEYPVVAGQEVYIAVGGYEENQGTYKLNLAFEED